MYRRGNPTETSMLQELVDRIKKLEGVASRRVLPPNYAFRTKPDGSIVIVKPDGTEQVI